jgi:hypothetical protein
MSNPDTTNASEGAERRPSLYANVLRAVCETPWAIRPEMLAVILDVVQMRAAGIRFTSEEVEQRVGAAQAARAARGQRAGGTVAVIPIYGVITPRADLFSQMSGGTSLESFQAVFKQAMADPEIGIDPPRHRLARRLRRPRPETAALIRSAQAREADRRGREHRRGVGGVLARVAGRRARRHPVGSVGSIGVFAAHDDVSAAQEKLGVKTTLISAGRYKVEGNPYEPLTDEARRRSRRTSTSSTHVRRRRRQGPAASRSADVRTGLARAGWCPRAPP